MLDAAESTPVDGAISASPKLFGRAPYHGDGGGLPSWHKSDPGLVHRAMAAAASPHCALMPEQLLPRLPRLVRASWNLKCLDDQGHKIQPTSGYVHLDHAAVAPWISLDAAGARNSIVIDIDHAGGPELVAQLPAEIRPHLVIDPYSGRSAAIFMLAVPVLLQTKNPKPRWLCDRVAEDLEDYFFTGYEDDDEPSKPKRRNATALRVGTLTKNPFGRIEELAGPQKRRKLPLGAAWPHPLWDWWQDVSGSNLVWHTIPGADSVFLEDVSEHLWQLRHEEDLVELPSRGKPFWAKSTEEVLDPKGRNDLVFRQLRGFAFRHAEQDGMALLEQALRFNSELDRPMDFGEVAGIARSVTRYMLTEYKPGQGDSWDRGVMQLQRTGLELPERQHLAALRTARVKRDATMEKLKGLIASWPEGQKLTQKALAEAADISIESVKRYWKKAR